MSWIPHPVMLEGDKVKLTPLNEGHFSGLLDVAAPKIIWTHLSIDGSDRNTLLTELQNALQTRDSGDQYPFVILDKDSGKPIGSTRFLNISQEHKKLEIGWTWYNPEYWGTGHNNECKFLLLRYCFETLGAIRVQLQTKEENLRSRAAIQKIGAKFEGVLRKERIRFDGPRNTAIFSIIDDEWPSVKAALLAKLNPK
jgi:RimJ/RimL family protein N-acetyltransferase